MLSNIGKNINKMFYDKTRTIPDKVHLYDDNVLVIQYNHNIMFELDIKRRGIDAIVLLYDRQDNAWDQIDHLHDQSIQVGYVAEQNIYKMVNRLINLYFKYIVDVPY